LRQIADLRQQKGITEDTIDEIITDVIPNETEEELLLSDRGKLSGYTILLDKKP